MAEKSKKENEKSKVLTGTGWKRLMMRRKGQKKSTKKVKR